MPLALGVEKIGEFVLEHPVDKNTSKVKRKVKLVLSKKIMWPGHGTVPRDSPKCGFEGEKCLPDPQQKEDKGAVKFLVHFISLYIYLYIYVLYIFIYYLYLYMYICIYMYVCVYKSLSCVCLHTYIHINIYIYI